MMSLLDFQDSVGFDERTASPPWGRRERGWLNLTLIVTIDRRVGLSLSRGERVWGRILFCGDEKLGCMVVGEPLRR